jgi:hypothetical protein
MAVSVSTFNWPPWVEAVVYPLLQEVHITVTYKTLSHSWVARQGDVYSRDTLRIATLVYEDLRHQQTTIDNITKRLTRKP